MCKAVSSFLICAMLVGLLAACGKGKSDKKTEATVTVTGVVWTDKRIYTDMAHISAE